MASTGPTARREVEAVVERYRQGFAKLDGEILGGLWDRSYDDLVYVALEEERPRRTWEAIADYYRAIHSGFSPDREATMELDELSVSVLGNFAHAFCRFRFTGLPHGDEARFVVAGRATFILRRHADAWRLIHYHESAPAGPGAEAT